MSFDANNRLNTGSYQYDAAGNVTQDSLHQYYYDAEDRLIQVDGTLGTCSAPTTACYVYDAEGRRVQKTASGGTVDYIYDIAGEQVAEVNASGGLNRVEAYAGGKHLATYTNGVIYFNHADWLGTERMRTTASGAECETIVSLAFGDGMSTSGSCTDASPMHFTGKQRDTETNLDYFGARYNASALGRFMSPDPTTMLPERLRDPQQINLYAYARGNPLRFLDPTGRTIDDSACLANKSCKKWEAKYKKSKEGLAQWNGLNDNKSLLVTLTWDKKATDSLTVPKWDSSGKLTAATVTLTPNSANSDNPLPSNKYPFGSTLTDPSERQVYVFGHELGHVEDDETPEGKASYQQAQVLGAQLQSLYDTEGSKAYQQDPSMFPVAAIVAADTKRNENVADTRAKGIVESYRACQSKSGCQ